MNEKSTTVIFTLLISVFVGICTGCTTGGPTWRGGAIGESDYIRPESTDAADYAIRERIYHLEQELDAANTALGQLREQRDRARDAAGEIRKSSEAIGELSRRSSTSLQEIIERMEALVLWIDWATNRIAYLEKLLEENI